MTIPSHKLAAYFPTMTFPAEVLAEKDNRVMLTVDQPELLSLIARNCVIGIGSWKKVKRLRFCAQIMPEIEKIQRETSYSRADLKYTYREAMENQPVTLKLALPDGSYAYWPDDAGFNPRRFNPDNLVPLTTVERISVSR